MKKEGQLKKNTRDTKSLDMCTETRINPQADRNRQNWKETEKKETKLQKWTATDKNRQKQRKRDSKEQKRTETDKNKRGERKKYICHV